MAGRQRIVINAATFLAFLITIVYFAIPTPGQTPFQFQQQTQLHHAGYSDSSDESSGRHATLGELNSNRTIQLVVGKLSHQDTTWLSAIDRTVSSIVYHVDESSAAYHVPSNKGNEAMTYLTYIIDHYDSLPAISIFLHPHRYAWHNNDLLDNDMVEMIRHLDLERVLREGYMNLRCQWGPGCPQWLHPGDGAVGAKMGKQEQLHISRVWKELFPDVPLPEGLSGPCCGQFAVSKAAIRRTPLDTYTAMRDWVLTTPLSDYIVGRCFEYLWQYIFTGVEDVCPDQRVCYCDGYGLCFENDAEFQKWFEIRLSLTGKVKEMEKWQSERDRWQQMQTAGSMKDGAVNDTSQPDDATGSQLEDQIARMERELTDRKQVALRRGQDPSVRAQLSGHELMSGPGA